MHRPILGLWAASLILLPAARAAAEDSAWVSLLNGKDLRDWTPYFQKTGIGNPDSSYKVTPEGWLFVDIHVSYNTTGFGHIFYTKRKFSYYMVRAEYRFTSEGYGPDWGMGWNRQNNGLMIHSQDPQTMKGKDFPTSVEVQLLGPKNEQNGDQKAKGFKYATSANLCTPSTFVAWNGNANYTQHCTAAQYPDAWKNTEIPWEDKDGWSDATVRVLADSMMQHYIHGVKVFEYTRIREDNGTPLKEGYLSLQAEGTSTQFRKLQVLDLVGCMDKAKSAYRSYFVKNDPAACNTIGIAAGATLPPDFALAREGSRLVLRGAGLSIAGARRADGSRIAVAPGATSFSPPGKGVYLVSIRSGGGIAVRKAAFL